MTPYYKRQIRKLIIQELNAMVGEEKLISKSELPDDERFKFDNPPVTLYKKPGHYSHSGTSCYECGGAMYEGECMECGYMEESMLNEGSCGCGGSSSDGTDYSIDSMMSPVYGIGATSMHIDFPNHGGIQHHGHNNYMAKPSLYKVAKYAQKLLHMIPDGYELDDWQRTKIAQISDDISEVYHSLDYDFHETED